MKKIILLIAVMVLTACGNMPTVKSVSGTYERIEDGDTYRGVLLENGDVENYLNGKKREEEEAKWSISKEGKLHITNPDGKIEIARINKDRSITLIAWILNDGRRINFPKEEQITAKKIK